jgi:hypothetical protein
VPNTGYTLYLSDFGENLSLSDLRNGYMDMLQYIEARIRAGEGASVPPSIVYGNAFVEIFYGRIESPNACTYRDLLPVLTALRYITTNQTWPTAHIAFSRASRYVLFWRPDPQHLSEAIGGGFITEGIPSEDARKEVSSHIDSLS